MDTPPPPPNCHYLHVVFGEIWLNNRLAPRLGLAHPQDSSGSATGFTQILNLMKIALAYGSYL